MNVSYQHANPQSGNESFLLRFEEDGTNSQTACILIDAGTGVDINEMLADDEYLTAIALTHAHSDHYQSLTTNLRDGAPIYTSEATASILRSVLDEAQHYSHAISNTDSVLDALEPLEGWESPIAGVRLALVPVGHTPGAAGFVLQFENDSDEWETILATGDWTWERAAGYPGFDAALPVDVGAVFLTAATSSDYEAELTESIETICEQSTAGSPVLLSASGLTGVQYAYLLGHLTRELSQPLSIILAGQAAKLYDDLGYDVPNVESVPEYDEPAELLAPETVTIAGPEVPTEGSSGRLFAEIRDNPNAMLVQAVTGGDTLRTSARCTIRRFNVISHPTRSEVDTLVNDLDPTQVIVTHQRGPSGSRLNKRYDSYVWAPGDREEYRIHDGNQWIAPPWMTSEGISYVTQSDGSGSTWIGETFAGPDEQIPLPTCKRVEEPDLAAEGLDMDSLEQRFRLSGAVANASSAGDEHEERSNDTVDESEVKRSAAEAVPLEMVESVSSRLEVIESQLAGTTLRGEVVDTGGDLSLVRVFGDLDQEDGQAIEVTVRDLDEKTDGEE